MSKTKWLLLLLILPVIFFSSATASSAATSTYTPKTLGKNIKTYSYVDQNGVTQLASIDCGSVPDVPGMRGLCGVFDSGLTSLGDTLGSAINGITDRFLDMLKSSLWNVLFGRKMGVVTLALQGLNNMLWGIDPGSYDAQSTAMDQQRPVSTGFPPFKLISAIYQNPPNLGTLDSLAYTVDRNILGINQTLAANCGNPNAPRDRNLTDLDDFYAQLNPGETPPANWIGGHPATEVCPGRIRLNPMYNIWEQVRNLSYVVIILVLIVFGFMVMFRSKIDPRTVISIQSVIPRLAIGLIAIAFSYIIASLAVDLGQVGLAAVGQFFNQVLASAPPTVKTGGAYTPFPYFEPIRGFNDKLSLDWSFHGQFGAFDLLAQMILGFVAWYIVFQVFFALITNYAQIFVKTVLGPLILAVGIIPGQSDALSKWFKGLLANALVFPAIYFVINIIVYIDDYVRSLFMPSPLNDDVKAFVMLGLFVIASKIPTIIEEFLGVQSSGAVARAGTDVSQAAKRIPVVGSFF